MTFKHTTKAVVSAVMLAALSGPVSASSWIDSLEISNTAIDTTPIEVSASPQGYLGPTTSFKTFGITVEGAASLGRRINGLTVSVGDDASVLEANPGVWSYDFTWAQIGSGNRRTLALDVDLNVPLGSVDWVDLDPLQACNANLQARVGAGWTQAEVLAQSWDLSVFAAFSAEMTVVHRNNVAPASETSLAQMQWQRDTMAYHVYVRCLPAVQSGGGYLAPPADTTSGAGPVRGLTTVRDDGAADRPARQDPRPERRETRPDRQEDRPERRRD